MSSQVLHPGERYEFRVRVEMSNDPSVFAEASYLFEVNPTLHSSSTEWNVAYRWIVATNTFDWSILRPDCLLNFLQIGGQITFEAFEAV